MLPIRLVVLAASLAISAAGLASAPAMGAPLTGPCGEGRLSHGLLEGGVRVVPASPAATAGIQDGDEIVSIDGEAIGPESGLAELVRSHAPGDRVRVEVRRAGQDDTAVVTVTLGERPEEAGVAFLGVSATPFMGMEGRPFPMEKFMLPGDGSAEGTFVAHVADESPAAAAGLEQGSLIVAIDGEDIVSPADLKAAIEERAPGDRVVLTVKAPGQDSDAEVAVTLGAHPQDADRAYLGVGIGFVRRMIRPAGSDGGALELPAPALIPSDGLFRQFERPSRPAGQPAGGGRA